MYVLSYLWTCWFIMSYSLNLSETLVIKWKTERWKLEEEPHTTPWAEDVGSVFLVSVAASAQTFSFFFFFSFLLSMQRCLDARHQPLLLHTSLLIHRRFGLQRKASWALHSRRATVREETAQRQSFLLICFVVFVFFFSSSCLFCSSASTVWLSGLFLDPTQHLGFYHVSL